MYEQLFQKPKMSEKLLTKPPFRYLHDIFTATLGKTGYGTGLFEGEELNSKSFEDKESKLAWLVKVITLAEMMNGEQIDIKPSMVLAGQQPEKTNLFLQMQFQAAASGIDSAPYVQQLLGGGAGAAGAEEDDGAAEQEAAKAQEEAMRQQQAEQEKAEKSKRAADKKKRAK